MSKFFQILSIIVGVLAFGLIVFLVSLGAFSKIVVTEKETGPYTYVYRFFVGDYKLTGPVFADVYNALKEQDIPAELGIGLYYDNPQTVPSHKLRSDCGAIIAAANVRKTKQLEKGYSVTTLPKARRLVAQFPIKNTMSYILGPMRVYPALMREAKVKGYQEMVTGIEIYDMTNKQTIYLMDIVKK